MSKLPKPANKKSRRSTADDAQILEIPKTGQPRLPNGYCSQTRLWWRAWKDYPLAEAFSAADWAFLLDTAFIHNLAYTEGEYRLFSEVRQRVQQFGVTPYARAKLRIQFATAQDIEDKTNFNSMPSGPGSRANAEVPDGVIVGSSRERSRARLQAEIVDGE